MKNTFLLIIGIFGFGFFGLAQPFDVVWTDLVGVTANGNSLTKIAPTNWGNAGAFSENKLLTGDDGWVEFTATEVSLFRMLGLSALNINSSYSSLNFAIYQAGNGYIYIYENGQDKGIFGLYSPGDIFRIERIGNTITYKKNGSIFYTSINPSNTDLYVDCALYSLGATISNVQTSFDSNGNGDPGGSGGGSSSSVWSNTGDDIYYNTGNVGIGNDTPTSLLHITATAATDKGLTIESGGNTNFQVMGDGRVFAREVEVTLSNFPDYVFAEDYTLKPLSQLKNYIEKNHHLPNIPSAKEVEKNGMGLGELNLRQVEKIEELTLYILQLDERLQKLEAENADLKQRLDQK